jgi:hypothetical protein
MTHFSHSLSCINQYSYYFFCLLKQVFYLTYCTNSLIYVQIALVNNKLCAISMHKHYWIIWYLHIKVSYITINFCPGFWGSQKFQWVLNIVHYERVLVNLMKLWSTLWRRCIIHYWNSQSNIAIHFFIGKIITYKFPVKKKCNQQYGKLSLIRAMNI